MDQRLEFEETSNDTAMISELLKSAEAMQSTTHPITCDPSAKNDLIQQRQTPKKVINVSERQVIMAGPSTSIDCNENNLLSLSQGLNVLDDSNKLGAMRHVNIPYILNGELYQIQKQEGENVTVKCCHCPPDRVYRGSVRSTGNFHMHIKRRHPDLLEKLHNMKVNALLERRDRLMRNRKVSSRTNQRNRQSGVGISSFMTQVVPVATVGELKDEANLNVSHSLEAPLAISSSPSELGLLHTHKLKIKEVFERHQLQKREAAEMRNWDNLPESDMVEPINYSLKSQEKSNEPPSEPTLLIPEQKERQNNLNSVQEQRTEDFANFSCRQLLADSKTIDKKSLDESQQCSIRDISNTSSQSSTSSSVLTNFSQQCENHPYSSSIIANISPHINCLREQKALTVIKPEQFMVPCEEQHAIDLTMHTDSGIFTSESTINTPHNNSNGSNTNGPRAGSQNMFTGQISGRCDGRDNVCKWQDLLQHVETSLRDIQHEMNIHNQIESNRILLDIAKFKYLHPGFQFNW